MKVLVIAWTNLVRTFRDRLGLFFIVLMPMIIIVTLGITYGGQGSVRVGVADADGGPFAVELAESVTAATGDARIEIFPYSTSDELHDAVARGFVQFGLAIEPGYDAALRNGQSGAVRFLAPPTTASSAVRATVERAVASQAALIRAARFAATAAGTSFDSALASARVARDRASGIAVKVQSVVNVKSSRASGFSIGAQSQLVLFMFLTSLVGAAELVVSRQLGITRRMLASPTRTWTIIAGEGLGRVGLAIFQGAFIVLASWLIFSVDWVDPAATVAIVAIFSFVGAGAAMLIGTIASNPSQAGALGPALGLVFGLIGGTMVPIEVFPEAMRTVAHVTPHAWAMDAFRALLFDDATLVDILPQLGVLALFAVVLVGLAVFRFHRLLRSGTI
jgi:ABC-2 type transport system permease protein